MTPTTTPDDEHGWIDKLLADFTAIVVTMDDDALDTATDRQKQQIISHIQQNYTPNALAKANDFDYMRLKKLESDSISQYKDFTPAKAGTTKRVVAFIHQLSPWNLQRGVDTINDLFTPNSEVERVKRETRVEENQRWIDAANKAMLVEKDGLSFRGIVKYALERIEQLTKDDKAA